MSIPPLYNTPNNAPGNIPGAHYNPPPNRSCAMLAIFYGVLALIGAFSFYKSCTKPPYDTYEFSRYQLDGQETSVVNHIRLYYEDSVLYVNETRYVLRVVQKLMIDEHNDRLLKNYISLVGDSTQPDTIYVGIETKHGTVMSVTVETPITPTDGTVLVDSEGFIIDSKIESYYN